ncbi:MAG TPA: hypothetical protein V6C71_24100 [Coleofasciculaceae cyanobacterium]|jgi:hypothetical protein
MKIRKIVALVLIFLLTASLVLSRNIKAISSPKENYQIQAKPSDNFVESLGINTKFGFCPGNLCDNYSKVKALLAELGIRYIRDIPYPESWRKRSDLYEDYGIRMLAETGRIWGGPLDSTKIPTQLDAIKFWGKAISGIAGANEYDSSYFHSCKESEGCDPNWSEESWSQSYREYQQRLYALAKAEPELRDLPVVMGPMAELNSLEQVDDLSDSCDKGNDHPYAGWGKPSQESGAGEKSFRSIDEVVAKVQQVCPGKKLWITETGYNQESITPQAQAKYLPRIYANYYLQGQIEKTFLFELLNAIGTETSFGIINTDLQPTPAYYAIKNMISLLKEANWNQKTQSWQYPDFEPSSLELTFEGDNSDLKHLLLQKSNGTFYLLIWQEVYVYDSRLDKDILNPDRPIKLKLDGEVIEKANKHLLYNESDPSKIVPLKTWTNVSSLMLDVPDHILVLEFTLKD